MINRPGAVCLVALFLGSCVTVRSEGKDNEAVASKYVQVNVSLSPPRLRRGESGTIQITFSPAEDIHVNADPSVTVRLASPQVVSLAGKTVMPIDSSTGYLSDDSPVTQRFTVSRLARPGTHRLKGSLVYYYCSNSEGWCRKQEEPIELTLIVTR